MKRDIVRLRVMHAINRRLGEASRLAAEEKAQGTTEYAILVGVLVVIAIIAIIAFGIGSASSGMPYQMALTGCSASNA